MGLFGWCVLALLNCITISQKSQCWQSNFFWYSSVLQWDKVDNQSMAKYENFFDRMSYSTSITYCRIRLHYIKLGLKVSIALEIKPLGTKQLYFLITHYNAYSYTLLYCWLYMLTYITFLQSLISISLWTSILQNQLSHSHCEKLLNLFNLSDLPVWHKQGNRGRASALFVMECLSWYVRCAGQKQWPVA